MGWLQVAAATLLQSDPAVVATIFEALWQMS